MVEVLGGRYKADARGNSISFKAHEDGKAYGPFFMTNLAQVVIAQRSFTVLFTTSDFDRGYEAGKQTLRLKQAIDRVQEAVEPADGLALLKEAAQANPLSLDSTSLSNVWKRLEGDAAEAERQRGMGRERFEGEWLPADRVAKLKAEQHASEMRAKGYEEIDGEWLTREAARDKRIEKAKAAAKELAERERKREAMKCRRCEGTGYVYNQIIQGVAATSTKGAMRVPDITRERPGKAPTDSRYKTEQFVCPDCRGSGQQKGAN